MQDPGISAPDLHAEQLARTQELRLEVSSIFKRAMDIDSKPRAPYREVWRGVREDLIDSAETCTNLSVLEDHAEAAVRQGWLVGLRSTAAATHLQFAEAL